MRLVCETRPRSTLDVPAVRRRADRGAFFRLTKKYARQISRTLFAIKFIKRRNPEFRRTESTASSGISCFLFLHQSLSDRSPSGSLNRTRCHFERSREIPRNRNGTIVHEYTKYLPAVAHRTCPRWLTALARAVTVSCPQRPIASLQQKPRRPELRTTGVA